MNACTIRPLIEYAAEVPRIAAWFYNEWRFLYGEETQASVQARIETWLTRAQIPTAFVAISDEQVVGTVALKERELPHVPHSPWLAGLFIVPKLRRQGIGALLADAVENKTATLGVERLWLFTETASRLYERLGWLVAERHDLSGR